MKIVQTGIFNRNAYSIRKVVKMYCTELDKYCNEITDEECDGCCDTCIFCDTYYDAK